MKNNKKDNPKSSMVTEDKKTANPGNNPTQKVRPSSNEGNEFPFKKVLYGYSPEEVAAFVDEMNKSHKSSLSLNESKLSSLKEELAISNRERDCYIEKCRELNALIKKSEEPVEDKSGEYEAAIAALTDNLRALENENEILRAQVSQKNETEQENYTSRIGELEERNRELEEILDGIRKENSGFSLQIQKYESLTDEYKAVLMRVEEAEALLSAREKELTEKSKELKAKTNSINALVCEKEELKKTVSELEVRADVLSRRAAEREEEIEALREANKAIVFENAEKITAIESEFAKSRLSAQKELRLYGYYINRAELTIAELSKQMEQIKESIEKSEI